jgi:NAD(P)-dependent dehydrogenase (short-subunit alcohol dehydrogenase family)
MELNGKLALVTGGASGIGAATAARLASEGCDVVIADVQDELGEKQAAEIGGRYLHLDVSDSAAWTELVGEIGPIGVAHLNAGILAPNFDVLSMSDDDYRRIMSINVDGVFFGLRAVGKAMAEAGGGGIVATASMAGLIAYGLDPIYNLTKHAVVGLVRGAGAQLQARGVTVNAVCPGVVDTPLVGEGRAVLEAIGFPMMAPEQVADAVISALTSGRTGECWTVLVNQPNAPHEFPNFDRLLSGGVKLPWSGDSLP